MAVTLPHGAAAPASERPAVENETMRKVGLRLIPFLVLCYFISYVDRVNVGFAALTMNKGRGLRHRRRAVLRRLRAVRGAEQSRDGEGRRAALDRAHHDLLGAGRHRLRLRDRRRLVLGRPLPARSRRGGFFPGVIL